MFGHIYIKSNAHCIYDYILREYNCMITSQTISSISIAIWLFPEEKWKECNLPYRDEDPFHKNIICRLYMIQPQMQIAVTEVIKFNGILHSFCWNLAWYSPNIKSKSLCYIIIFGRYWLHISTGKQFFFLKQRRYFQFGLELNWKVITVKYYYHLCYQTRSIAVWRLHLGLHTHTKKISLNYCLCKRKLYRW